MQGVVEHLRPKSQAPRAERPLGKTPEVMPCLAGTGDVEPTGVHAATPNRTRWASSEVTLESAAMTANTAAERDIGSSLGPNITDHMLEFYLGERGNAL